MAQLNTERINKMIDYWREKRDKSGSDSRAHLIASCYVDAYQCVRVNHGLCLLDVRHEIDEDPFPMNNIKKARLKTGLNIAEYSAALNVHRDTYSKWEREIQRPPAAAMTAIELIEFLHRKKLLSGFLRWRRQQEINEYTI